MAFEIPILDLTREAASDLSTKQFFIVKRSGSGKIALAGVGEQCYGVLQDKPGGDGHAANVRVAGVSKVVAGAAITEGDPVASDANGKAKTAVKSSGAGITGSYVLGIALDTAAADGDVISVLITHAGAVPTIAA